MISSNEYQLPLYRFGGMNVNPALSRLLGCILLGGAILSLVPGFWIGDFVQPLTKFKRFCRAENLFR